MKITRRAFGTGLTVALAGAAAPELLSATLPTVANPADTDLSDGWSLYAGTELLEEGITLPHSVLRLSWHGWQPSSWEKLWTYRRRFDIRTPLQGSRLFIGVDRALANARVNINGQLAGNHQGGFTPFSFEITSMVRHGTNEIDVAVDSSWLNVPPSGSSRGPASVDYYLPGGIAGTITLKKLPRTAIRDVSVETRDVLSDHPSLQIALDIESDGRRNTTVLCELYDGERLIHSTRHPLEAETGTKSSMLHTGALRDIQLWSPDHPQLYRLVLSLLDGPRITQTRSVRIGFREARFELDGFYLNGKKTRLFGLNRHELFPYVGFAASDRAMRRDAAYLRDVLNCNAVRCSHYPQSTAFLDACDELGLMVWEEIPGWQYLGDSTWKDVAVRNTEEMIRRDRQHPSIIAWGTRVNESANDPDLYERTRAIAKHLDPTRPTSGSMTPSSKRDWKEHWHEDVFAFDDYHAAPDGSVGIDPALPGVPYMLAEAVGQFSYGTAKNFLRPYRRAGIPEEQNDQALLHAQAHDRAAQDPHNAGVLAWCAYDYASPMNAYNGVKCPGVVDTFRIPKLGAAFYMAQIDPAKRLVLGTSFYWDATLHANNERAAVFSNCEELKFYLDDRLWETAQADRVRYPRTAYPPIFASLPWDRCGNSILRIDGYLAGRLVLSRSFDGDRKQDQLWITADDDEIFGDGKDTTRIAFGIADRFGNARPIANGVIKVALQGSGEIVGDTDFDLRDSGAVGAVWLKGKRREQGNATIGVSHPDFGHKAVSVRISRQ